MGKDRQVKEAMLTTNEGLVLLAIGAAILWGFYGYALWLDHRARTRRRTTYIAYEGTPHPVAVQVTTTNKHKH